MNKRAASMTKTDWSLIQEAGGDGAEAAVALEQLARRYWPPVYAYIRSTGRDVHEAADLTQGFVCEVIMQRQLFNRADPVRGRFRALLVTALRNYLAQVHRSGVNRARHHAPSLINPAEITASEVRTHVAPEQAFCMQWSATIISRVLEQVRDGCLSSGQEPHWIVFEQRVARPLLLNERPEDYEHLVKRLGLESASQAANMMVTVKRRFARTLIAEVRNTIEDPDEAEAELHDLLRGLDASQPGEGAL